MLHVRGKDRILNQLIGVVFIGYIFVISCAQAESADNYIEFDMPSARADMVLNLFAKQCGVQLLFPYDMAVLRITNRVVGLYTPEAALAKLLSGTDLSPIFNEHGDVTIHIVDKTRGGGKMQSNENLFSKLSVAVLFVLVVSQVSQAQVTTSRTTLEEVVVTAQRRVQSLQDVPISIDVVSGDTIDKQGFAFLRDLADFTPGIVIKNDLEEQGMMVRGNGNTGKNLSIKSAAPTFVNGIHFGLASQTTNAFLDIERVELLKGPQPVYFGQSAIAGALSITTRKPTPQWEGRALVEYANNNSHRVEFGLGGPITDTFGIRVAGKLNQSDGYMKDIFTDDRFPFTREKTGRVTLQWTPTEALAVTAKFEYSTQDTALPVA